VETSKLFTASQANPISWWLLALCLAVLAGSSSNWVLQLVIAISSLLTVFIFREDAPWSKSIRFYIYLAIFVVVFRVIFRIIFNIPIPGAETAFDLPSLEISLGFGPSVSLFGQVSFNALQSGATDGLRLAAIILAIAMATSLANPRRLLKSTPGALYEIASAISVAINLAPQLINSLQRVRRARMLRGRSKGLGAMAGIVIPVLEDAIDGSLSLAASMDARGFGRKGQQSKTEVLLSRLVSLLTIALIAIGSFLLLTSSENQLPAILVLFSGVVSTYFTIKLNSKASLRTRLKPEKWMLPDYVLLFLSTLFVLLALSGWVA
jgi:energy-coupling factor transport system permease protein